MKSVYLKGGSLYTGILHLTSPPYSLTLRPRNELSRFAIISFIQQSSHIEYAGAPNE